MGAARLYRVGTPYNAAELQEIDFEQTADLVYLAHWDHPPTRLTRSGHTSWLFESITFGSAINPPGTVSATASTPNSAGAWPITFQYVVTAIDAATGQESRLSSIASCSNDLSLAGNLNTIAWTAVTGAERYSVYKDENEAGNFGFIGDSEGVSFKDNNISPAQTDAPPIARNPFDGAGNYPSSVTFFEQRVIWGRTRNKPNGVWGSQSSNYENMDTSRPLRPDDALAFALAAGRVNQVNQLVALTDLLAFGSDGLFRINGGGQGGYLTPTNIVSRRQAGFGSSRLGPLIIGQIVFYKPSVGLSVRAVGFTFEVDGYRSNDVTIFSPDLFDNFDIVSWCYASTPLSCVWAARSDGKLLCFTWEEDQQVWGWSLCETDGRVESVACVPEQGEDRLYAIIARDFNGSTRRFVERMDKVIFTSVDDGCWLDSAISKTFSTPSAVVGGLRHLEGRTVSAVADGSVINNLVVFQGKVTLPQASTRVTVGLPYTALIETLPLGLAIQGTMQTKKQTIKEAVVRTVRSRGGWAGVSPTTMFEIKDRVNEVFGLPPEVTSADHDVTVMANWTSRATIVVEQRDPLPFEVTGIFIDPAVTS